MVTVALLGHKADLGVLAIGPDCGGCAPCQTALRRRGPGAVGSYVSLTEVSEYARACPRR